MLLELAFNIPVDTVYTYESAEEVPVGCRVTAMLGPRRLTGWVVGHSDKCPEGVALKPVQKIVDASPLFDAELLALARWLADLTFSSLGETLASMLPGGRREKRGIPDIDDGGADIVRSPTESQSAALTAIEEGVKDARFYLYGATGSGKTEVFLRAAEAVLSEGRGVIYLVPEIALSHHLVESLQGRFPGKLAVIHSGLTPSRRLAEWRRIQSGEARFVLGARSAVFAPLKELGLVILDEEHEGSYKSSSSPRYHARQVAMKRCRDHGAKLVMGSATPSVEAWRLMKDGLLTRLKLQGRPAGGASPAVSIVDLKREKGLFSRELVEAMTRVLGEGRQVLLFLNRRGFSYHYSCSSCGEELHCRNCSVPLTYHKAAGRMVCHYCGYRSVPPAVCPECGSVDMRAAGFGTEKVEEEIAALFPEKRSVRLDADTAKKKGVLEETLRDFREGGIDILLGTQMVAKGLNAPGVKLAAVLSADTSLNLPDFRSAERTFALIVQVAGRAGRFLPDGEVLVQTFRPESPAVRLAAEGRVAEFYDAEMEERNALGFPPYSRLFRVVVRGRPEERVRAVSEDLAAFLANGGGAWELLGPAECPIGKVAGQYRRHLILRSKAFDRTHAALAGALLRMRLPYGVRIEADVDPVSML